MARRLLPIIDFAHGSDVAGKQSPDGRHKEYLWSRKVGKMLAERLKQNGFEVAFTNTKDTEIGLSRRKEIANNLDTPRGGAKFLLSLHNNAAGMGNEWCTARGFEYSNNCRKTSPLPTVTNTEQTHQTVTLIRKPISLY